MNIFVTLLFLLVVVFFRVLMSGRFRRAIDQNNIILLVYNRAKPNGTKIALSHANNITEVSQFNTNLKTIFFIHGWQDIVDDDLTRELREAILSSADVNTIIVNWEFCGSNEVYLVSHSCVADVGTYVGEFVQTMSDAYNYSKSDITVVGHSLGAHIAGYIGKTTNGSLGVIVGLDPAGPLFYQAITSTRLYETDAQYVQSVHTETRFYGVNFRIGHANFWPNGGSLQNGCGTNGMCSHKIAVNYFAESVSNNSFYARQCNSYSNFEDGDCSKNITALMAGINIDNSITGDYYLNTNAISPYGQGDIV